MSKKKIHFEHASPDELAEGKRGLAAWFDALPPELRAEIERQAARDEAPAPPAPAPTAKRSKRGSSDGTR